MKLYWLAILLMATPVAAAGLGDVGTVDRLPDGLRLHCADGAIVDLQVRTADLIRVRAVRSMDALVPDHSWALADTAWPKTAFTSDITPSMITLKTADVQVQVTRSPVRVTFLDARGQVINADGDPMELGATEVSVSKKLGFDEHIYGLGEKAAHMDHRHERFTMWNSDTPGWGEGTELLYQSIPFYIGWQNARAYGLYYDNSYRSTFDIAAQQIEDTRFHAAGGDIDYYFMYGPSIRQVLGLYADLTGHMPLPPRWAVGNQQSRWAYSPAEQAEALVHRYRQEHLPLDAIHLDIDYMNQYRVFTWDTTKFPNPAGFVADLLQQGVHVVTIIDPGVKYQPTHDPAPAGDHPELQPQDRSYYAFNEGAAHDYFLRRRDGSLWIGKVWPGEATFVDYTLEAARHWWGDLLKANLDAGVAGIWNDMNEPSDFVDQTGKTQQDVVFNDLGAHGPYAKFRNLFALLEARATFEGMSRLRPRQRPFIITRAGFAGIQRYSTMWTGDNTSTWSALAITLPEYLSLGLSGEPFVGCDIGGFIGRSNGELLTRWYELGFLTPLCRNHHTIDGYDQEPWRFGTAYEDIIRRYLQLRYRLMPYLYTVLEEAHRTGVPWFRPLVLEFPSDRNTDNLDDEVMIGPALLLAPVTEPHVRQRDVYLPPGRWYDFWTGGPVEGGRLLTVAAPLDRVPLFVRGGSVIPMGPVMDYIGQKPVDPLEFDIYPDAAGRASGTLYEDDGTTPDYAQGAFARSTITVAGHTIHWSGPQGAYHPPSRHLLFRHGSSTIHADDDHHPHTLNLP